LLGFALAVELERLGAHDRRFIADHVSGYDEFMALARSWPAEKAAEVCGVPAADIRLLASWMASAQPLVIAPGNGLERGRNGGSGVRAAIALPALLGRLGRESGIVLCLAHPPRSSPGRDPHAQHPRYRPPPCAG